MKYFCSKCGKTTQYNFELPKFCAYCGYSFNNQSTSVETEDKRNKFLNELKLKKNINSANIEDDMLYNSDYNPNDNQYEEYIVSDFKKIKPSFKLNVYKNKGESFGSLIDNPSKSTDEIGNFQSEAKTKEDILNEFQREAGSLRQK